MVTFINSIVWIAIFSYLMVWMVAVIGFTFGIPDSIMGITFLAAGTSVPDAMASVMVARQGEWTMGSTKTVVSGVFVGQDVQHVVLGLTSKMVGTFMNSTNISNLL